MTEYGRCGDIISLVVNPTSFLPDLPTDKVRFLLVESDSYIEDYKREMIINFIAGNFSSSKHLCTTILMGKDDKEILEIMDGIKKCIGDELEARKKNPRPLY